MNTINSSSADPCAQIIEYMHRASARKERVEHTDEQGRSVLIYSWRCVNHTDEQGKRTAQFSYEYFCNVNSKVGRVIGANQNACPWKMTIDPSSIVSETTAKLDILWLNDRKDIFERDRTFMERHFKS